MIESVDLREMLPQVFLEGVSPRPACSAAKKQDRFQPPEPIPVGAKISDEPLALRNIPRIFKPSSHSPYFEQPPSVARGRISINAFGLAKH